METENMKSTVNYSLSEEYKIFAMDLSRIEKGLKRLDDKLLAKFPDRTIVDQGEESVKDAIRYICQLVGMAILYDLEK